MRVCLFAAVGGRACISVSCVGERGCLCVCEFLDVLCLRMCLRVHGSVHAPSLIRVQGWPYMGGPLTPRTSSVSGISLLLDASCAGTSWDSSSRYPSEGSIAFTVSVLGGAYTQQACCLSVRPIGNDMWPLPENRSQNTKKTKEPSVWVQIVFAVDFLCAIPLVALLMKTVRVCLYVSANTCIALPPGVCGSCMYLWLFG